MKSISPRYSSWRPQGQRDGDHGAVVKLSRVFVHERIPGLAPRNMPARWAGMPPPMTPMTETTTLSDSLLFR